MILYRLDITIQDLPPRPNNSLRANLWVNRRIAAEWKDMVWKHCLGKKPSKPLKRAFLTLTRASSVEPDYDGLSGSFKHVIDGLVAAGVIENDKVSNIGAPRYLWKKASPKQGFIRIQVEQVESREGLTG